VCAGIVSFEIVNMIVIINIMSEMSNFMILIAAYLTPCPINIISIIILIIIICSSCVFMITIDLSLKFAASETCRLLLN